MRLRCRLLSAAAVACMLIVADARAEDAASMRLLTEQVMSSVAPWSARLDSGRLVLENRSEETASRYVPMPWQGQAASGRSVASLVGVSAGPNGGAGLLYGLDPGTGRYFAFMVTGDGKIALYQRTTNIFAPITVSKQLARRDGNDRLEIQEAGNVARFIANGAQIFSFEGTIVGRGQTGIIATGAGRFSFKDFGFAATAGAAPVASAASGSAPAPDAAAPQTAGAAPIAGDIAALPDRPEPKGGLADLLLGSWTSETQMAGQQLRVRTTFGEEGFYGQIQTLMPSGFTVQVMGAWVLESTSEKTGTLTTFPDRWLPKNFCETPASCAPLAFEPTAMVVKVIDRDTIEVEGSRLTRVQ